MIIQNTSNWPGHLQFVEARGNALIQVVQYHTKHIYKWLSMLIQKPEFDYKFISLNKRAN